MHPLTVLITGGNSGIGQATATRFAREGHAVVITVRNLSRGRAVVADIVARTGNAQVRCLPGDLSTIGSCRALVATIRQEVPTLQILINNAGVFMTERVLNADGFETNFMVNYLAPFILTTGLADLLTANAPARVLTVSSGLHLRGHFDLACTPYGLDFDARGSYRNAKLANALFTVELAARLANTAVTVNAFSPGLYNTTVFKVKGLTRLFYRVAGAVYALFHPIASSAAAPYYLATAPELASVSGAYFDQQQRAEFAGLVADTALRRQLWDQTLAWLAA